MVVPDRAQSSNLLLVEGKPILVDSGAGVLRQLKLAGFNATDIETVVISHLHQDHISGLGALLGLRWQQTARKDLTIYGPPGIDKVVKGLLDAMQPSIAVAEHEPMAGTDPNKIVHVKIVKSGDTFDIGGVQVKAIQNSHFDEEPTKHMENGTESLSYRFTYKNYSIGFTGDTGPCAQCAELFKEADMLVSEVLDLPKMEVFIKGLPMPDKFKRSMVEHFKIQHLTPQEAGKLATEFGVKTLVFTHIGVPGPTDKFLDDLIGGAQETFKGKVLVAHDMDKF